MTVEITVQYFDGCPHWERAKQLVLDVTEEEAIPATIRTQKVDTRELAQMYEFRGSPTILIDGVDPFMDPHAPIDLSCRLFPTPEGLRGTPTKEQLIRAFQEPATTKPPAAKPRRQAP